MNLDYLMVIMRIIWRRVREKAFCGSFFRFLEFGFEADIDD